MAAIQIDASTIQWIQVTDRLPEMHRLILFGVFDHVWTGTMTRGRTPEGREDFLWADDEAWAIPGVTRWAELPDSFRAAMARWGKEFPKTQEWLIGVDKSITPSELREVIRGLPQKHQKG